MTEDLRLFDPDAEHTVGCPDCAETFTSPTEGGANRALGTHRYRAHGVASPRRQKGAKGRERPTDQEMADHPVTGVLRDMQAEIGTGTGPPNTGELTRAFGRGLGLVSSAVASYAVETDELLPLHERDQVAARLSISQRRAEDVVRPLAKLTHGTKVNTKFGRKAVENVDAIASISEIGMLAMEWRRYFKERAQRQRIARGEPITVEAEAVLFDAGLPPPPGPGPGGSSVEGTPIPPEPTTSPSPSRGVVMTPEMIEAIRRRGNGNGRGPHA